MGNRGKKHLVIPDTQIKPGLPPEHTEHIDWIARFVVEKKPDVIVIIGDWADMESLSSYDKGKKSFEGRTYRADILAANDALQRLMAPIDTEIKRTTSSHRRRWNPRKIVTLGNHENRITRAIENQRELDGLISLDDLFFKQWGFEVYPFLQPVTVDGVCYCHYFCSGVMGHAISTARALITKGHMSQVAGHKQGKDIAHDKRADGTKITAVQVGSCYLHEEGYLNPQTNDHWRGVMVLNEVRNGEFDDMAVSLDFLKERYGKTEKERA